MILQNVLLVESAPMETIKTLRVARLALCFQESYEVLECKVREFKVQEFKVLSTGVNERAKPAMNFPQIFL